MIGRAGPPKTGKGSNSVSPALSSDQLHGGGGEGLEEGKRQITPDIIKVMGSCRLANCIFGKLPFGKIPLGSCHLGKYPWGVATWENSFGKVPNIDWTFFPFFKKIKFFSVLCVSNIDYIIHIEKKGKSYTLHYFDS